MTPAEPTLNSRLSPAEICRRNGWGVGTRLVGDEGYGPTVLEITCLGEEMMLARTVSHNGVPMCGWPSREHSWTLDCRDWQVAL